MSRRVIVIGAGMGGLSAAIALAARGYRVTLLEKQACPGGKMAEVRAGDFRWDTGPSVITMRHVYEQLFALANRCLEDYVQLVPLQPLTRYFWRDGVVLDAVSDLDVMHDNIRNVFGAREAENYRRFMRYVARLHEVVGPPFLYRRKPTLRDLFQLPIADVLRLDALRTMHQAICSYFQTPHLRQLFDRFATYNGSSPYCVPATLNVIAYVEMAQGAWYPRGGVFQLALAFERLARELGVELCYQAPAARIVLQGDRVKGVQVEGGVTLPADAVVCNVDYTFALESLIPERRSRVNLEPSCSGFVLLIGARGERARLAHHNIFFTDDYPREFADIFERRVAPVDPTLYVCITSKTDPNHAPPSHENWFVLVNAPYLSDAFDWSREADRYMAQVLDRLQAWARQIAPESPLEVVHLDRWTPADLQARYGGYRGAIYGFSSNTRLAAFSRPNNRHPRIRRLYFAGGSVHPGGGVPLVTLSGMAAAQCVAEDLPA